MRWVLFILALVFVSYVFGENSWPFYIIGAILFLIFNPNKKRDRLTGSGHTTLGLSVSPQSEANHIETVSSQAEEPQKGQQKEQQKEQVEHIGLVHAQPTSMPAGLPVVLETLPPEDSEIVQAIRSPFEQPKRPKSRRKLLIVGGFLVAVVIVWLSIGHHQEPIPSGRESIVWDPQKCSQDTFPRLSEPFFQNYFANSPGGKIWLVSSAMFCARQWDDDFFARTAKTLEDNGMLVTQWNGYGDKYDMPPKVANFFKVFQAGVLLVADHDILVRMKSETPGLPDIQVIEAVRKQIDIDRNCVDRNAKPMTYVVHSGEPAISLVTDIGIEMTLRDLIWGSANRTFSKEFKTAEGEVSSLSGDISASTVAGNMYAMGLVAILQMNLQLALQQRFAASGTTAVPLKDLKVVFLSHDQPGFILPKDRPAYYDSGESVLYARLEHAPSLHNGDSIEQVALATTQTLPATMLHEFYHYLYYRPSVSNSGFALEGEATAYGEVSEQQIVAGATLGPKDKLRLLARQILTSPSTSAAATSEFNRLARSRLNGIPYTPVQCSLMRQAITDHIAPLRPLALQARLTLTPRMFQSQPDLAAEYSEAWAVYHVDSVEHRGWSKWIEAMVTKLNSHQELGETDLQQLKFVNDETLAWLSKESAGGAPQCLALPDGTNTIVHERRE